MKRLRPLARLILLAAAVAVAGGVALAQDAPPAPADSPEAPEREDESADPAAQIPMSRYGEVAQENIAAMRTALDKAQVELKTAREKRDAVEFTCVNENVTAMKGILKVAEEAVEALREALESNDTGRARYEFRKIHVSKRKMDDLLTAAINCVGADATASNTSVDMAIDPDLADFDPYYGDPSFFYDPTTTLIAGDTGVIGEEDPPDVRPPPVSDNGQGEDDEG